MLNIEARNNVYFYSCIVDHDDDQCQLEDVATYFACISYKFLYYKISLIHYE